MKKISTHRKFLKSWFLMGVAAALLPVAGARCDILPSDARLDDAAPISGTTSVLSYFRDNTPQTSQFSLNSQSLMLNRHRDGAFGLTSRLLRTNPFSFSVDLIPDYTPNFGFNFAGNIASSASSNFDFGSSPDFTLSR